LKLCKWQNPLAVGKPPGGFKKCSTKRVIYEYQMFSSKVKLSTDTTPRFRFKKRPGFIQDSFSQDAGAFSFRRSRSL